MKLLELAELCERATGPDDGTLDRIIFHAIGGSGEPMDPWGGFRSYTDSVDAAMTLIPDGAGLTMIVNAREGFTVATVIHDSPAKAATPALAVCAAALRARAAQ